MSEWQQARGRRERRLQTKAESARASRGARKPEWQCGSCSRTNYLEKWTCRGTDCNKARDPAKDTYINEWGQRAWWPAEHGKPKQSTSPPPAPGPQAPANPASPSPQQKLTHLRKELQQAEQNAWDEETITFMRERVRKLEETTEASRPIGQRLDSKRAALRRACDRTEKAMTAVAAWKKELLEAKTEVQTLEREVTVLTQEAGRDRPSAGIPGGKRIILTLAQTLENLAGAVERSWTPPGQQQTQDAIPAHLSGALQATHSMLAELSTHIGMLQEVEEVASDNGSEDEPDDPEDGCVTPRVLEPTPAEARVQLQPRLPTPPAAGGGAAASSDGAAQQHSLSPRGCKRQPEHQLASPGDSMQDDTPTQGDNELTATLARARRLVGPVAEIEY